MCNTFSDYRVISYKLIRYVGYTYEIVKVTVINIFIV